MLDVFLYNNSAEKHRIDKTSFLSAGYPARGNWRESTSIVNPEIVIQGGSLIIPTFNYCKIPAFNRYYYVVDIVTEANGLYRFYLKVDVLMSFKTQILSLSAFVNRNEFNFNNNLPDERLPMENSFTMTHYECIKVSGSNRYNDLIKPSDYDNTNQMYIICVPTQTNPDNNEIDSPTLNTNGARYFAINKKVLNTIFTYMYTDASFWSDLLPIMTNVADAIYSIRLFPFLIGNALGNKAVTLTTNFLVGNTPIPLSSGDSYIAIKKLERLWIKGGSIKIGTYGSNIPFQNLEPYSTCKLFIPFVGLVDISLKLIYGRYIYLNYLVDLTNGTAIAYLTYSLNDQPNNDTLNDIPSRAFMQIPCEISAELLFMKDSYNINAIRVGSSLMAGAIKTFTSMINYKNELSGYVTDTSENVEAKVEATKQGMIKTVGNYGGNAIGALMSGGSAGSIRGGSATGWNNIEGCLEMFAIVENRNFLSPTNYNHYFGKPCKKTLSLNNVYGYTEISSVHLEGFLNATPNELNEIETSLKSGVLLPDPPSN